MSKTFLPALACSLAAIGWAGIAVANPPAHPTDHPAPEDHGGDHKEGDHKTDPAKDGHHDSEHHDGEAPKTGH